MAVIYSCFARLRFYLPLAAALLVGLLREKPQLSAAYMSDLLFLSAAVYIMLGLCQVVANIGLFHGTANSLRKIARIFAPKSKAPWLRKMDLVEFMRSRKKYPGYTAFLLFGLALLALSAVLLAF